jgi:hypothetical protein
MGKLLKLLILIKLINFAILLNNDTTDTENWSSMNIFLFYDKITSNQFNTKIKNFDDFKNYLTIIFNNTIIDIRYFLPKINDNDLIFHDCKIYDSVKIDNLVEQEKLQIKFKFKNSTFFYFNIFLLNLNENYIKQMNTLNKIINLNETPCEIQSKLRNQYLFLFLSDSKLINLFINYWPQIPMFLVDAKSFQQVCDLLRL